jgi:Tol biopolymer transport system component
MVWPMPGRTGLAALLSGVVAAGVCVGGGCGGPRRTDDADAGRADAAPEPIVYEQDRDGNVDIYVVPAPGGTPRRLTRDPGVDCHARWMPDGRRIVYTAGRGGKPQLWEVRAEGGAPRPVRRNDAAESQPDPSPDGRRLAFISDIGGSDRLMMMDLETGVTTTLVRHRDRTIFGNPHWSPDGSEIVFSSNRGSAPTDGRSPSSSGAIRAPPAASSSRTSRRERAGSSSTGPPSTTTSPTLPTAARSPSPPTSPGSG